MFKKKKSNYLGLLMTVVFLLSVGFAINPYSAEAGGTITGITPSNNNYAGAEPPANNNQAAYSVPHEYNSYGNGDSAGPFEWWGINLDISPFVSQNYSNPISQIGNISDNITGINGQSVIVPLNYALNDSNFNGNGVALRYHSFNHIISAGNFLPPPISWLLFFVPSFKDKYYYSSSNFNLSYVNSSNLNINTTDANITGKMRELFLRYYWNPIGVDYPFSIDNNNITLVPYADLGIGGFTDFFYANDFASNNHEDPIYVALTNPQAANDEYAQGLYGLGLRYGGGVQVFAKNLVGQVSFHILPYNFKRGFAAPGFVAVNQGASLPSPNMTEHIFDAGIHYNFISNWYIGLNYENDSFQIGSIGQTPVSLSNTNATINGSSAGSSLTADSFYSGGTMKNSYLYLTLGYGF